jgi:hypothetical protein
MDNQSTLASMTGQIARSNNRSFKTTIEAPPECAAHMVAPRNLDVANNNLNNLGALVFSVAAAAAAGIANGAAGDSSRFVIQYPHSHSQDHPADQECDDLAQHNPGVFSITFGGQRLEQLIAPGSFITIYIGVCLICSISG